MLILQEKAGPLEIELYDDLCDLCGIQSYAALDEVLSRFRTYRAEREGTPVEDR